MKILDFNSEEVQKLIEAIGIDPNKVITFSINITRNEPASITVQYFIPTKDLLDFTQGVHKYVLVER